MEHSSVLSAVKAASSNTLSPPDSTVCRHYHAPRGLGVETEAQCRRAAGPGPHSQQVAELRTTPGGLAPEPVLSTTPDSGALSPALSTEWQWLCPKKNWLMGPRGPAFSKSSTGWTWAAPHLPRTPHSTLSEASLVWVLWPKMNRRLTLEGTPPVMEAHRYGNGS